LLVKHWKGARASYPEAGGCQTGRNRLRRYERGKTVGPERLAGPREPATAEPFTPGRFIRPRVMLKPSSVGEWIAHLDQDSLYEHLVDPPWIVATVRYAAPLRQLGGAPAAVTTVHLNDPELVDDLMELLRGSDCIVDRIGPRSVATTGLSTSWTGTFGSSRRCIRAPGRCEIAAKAARPLLPHDPRIASVCLTTGRSSETLGAARWDLDSMTHRRRSASEWASTRITPRSSLRACKTPHGLAANHWAACFGGPRWSSSSRSSCLRCSSRSGSEATTRG
jgi:hypothetical protein